MQLSPIYRSYLMLAALVQASMLFNLIMSQSDYTSSRTNFGQIGFGTSLLAKKTSTIGGTLKHSDQLSSSKIFEQVILNRDLKEITTLVISDSFKVPSPSIFGPPKKHESEFGETLFRNRLQPKLKNAAVLLLIYSIYLWGMTSIMMG
jgi:hypothetical protein